MTGRLARWKEFEILRRPPDVLLAMRRIVYDNDHPAKDLANLPRWQDFSGVKAWSVDPSTHTFVHQATGEPALAWLRYQHIIGREGRQEPELITDFMGYNSFTTQAQPEAQQTQHWVGDLMIDCEVKITKPEGQMVLELSRGKQRFRANFDLATGECA